MKPLKRHPALIELSREHHHALSLCVRLLRAPAESHQTELEAHFLELEPHFVEEETIFAVTLRDHARFEERELFPAVEPFLPEPEGI